MYRNISGSLLEGPKSLCYCYNAPRNERHGSPSFPGFSFAKEFMERLFLIDVSEAALFVLPKNIIYYRGKVVGGIYDDRFLVKPTKSSVAMKRIQPMNR